MYSADIVDEIERRGGIARASTLLQAGARKRDLLAAVEAGVIQRVREGVYCTPMTPSDVVVAACHGGELACVSALQHHGIWLLEAPAAPHVWLGAKGRRHQHKKCRCVDHHDKGSAAFGTVSVRRALVQAATCVSGECFFAAYESAWRQRLISSRDRHWIRARVPARVGLLMDFARNDADSGIESIFRLRLARCGVSVECQVAIDDVGRVDFRVRKLLIEIDGRQNHEGQSLRHKDLVRDAAAAARGYETLRFDYAQIAHDWATVEEAVLARIRAHGVPIAGADVAGVASAA